MDEQRLRELYDAFNSRDIDTALAAMTSDVDWPNAWEGGRVHGPEAVRAYWTRQWAELDSWVEPIAVSTRSDGRVAVDVRQGARNQAGEAVGESRVRHLYELRDGFDRADGCRGNPLGPTERRSRSPIGLRDTLGSAGREEVPSPLQVTWAEAMNESEVGVLAASGGDQTAFRDLVVPLATASRPLLSDAGLGA